MNIGQASRTSGLSAKMIRYYESTGLIPVADRRQSGYRDYSESDVHRLVFVQRARELGFSIELIRDLLGLWSKRSRSTAEVRARALEHIAGLEAHAAKLQEMISALRGLVTTGKRGGRPEYPVFK